MSDSEENGTTRRFRPVTGAELADDAPERLAHQLRFVQRDLKDLTERVEHEVMPALKRIEVVLAELMKQGR